MFEWSNVLCYLLCFVNIKYLASVYKICALGAPVQNHLFALKWFCQDLLKNQPNNPGTMKN